MVRKYFDLVCPAKWRDAISGILRHRGANRAGHAKTPHECAGSHGFLRGGDGEL